jgi:acetyltransferase-like isoleucine patch superfamily enzyme
MPIDRDHAFADGVAFARPKPAFFRILNWTAKSRAAQAWAQFDRSAKVAKGCLLGPNAWCINSLGKPDNITLAARVVCRGVLRLEQFGEGRIIVGEDSYLGDDTLLSSAVGIEIGQRVLIAHGVQIFDNDSHPLDAAARRRDFLALTQGGKREPISARPIRIGDDAWIGLQALIMKGVTIGEGAVVAAGAVVARDVPPGAVVAGNPAVLVKTIGA